MSILDATFNCQQCNKTLWTKYYKLPNGKIVCPKCYSDYQNREEIEKQKKIEELEKRKKHIETEADKILDKGLGELIYNFFEKYGGKPTGNDFLKLLKLLRARYKINIDSYLCDDVVRRAYCVYKEKKELDDFENDLMPKKVSQQKEVSKNEDADTSNFKPQVKQPKKNMNSTLRNGVILLVLGIIFIILAIFVFPFLSVAMIFSLNAGGMMIFSFLIFIFFILGIIFIITSIFLIILGFIREPRNLNVTQNQIRHCPVCGRNIQFDANMCPYCGRKF